MKQYLRLAVFAVALLGFTGPAMADRLGAHMSGVQEVPPVFTSGHAYILVSFSESADEMTYGMVYFDLGSTVTQAHIHFGQPGVNGGIMAFLCSNLGGAPSGVPPCPNNPGVNAVSGKITPASIVGSAAAQGVTAGNFEAFREAVIEGGGYANIHTTSFPAGEIRGPLGH